ncbi:hypothetical protein AB0I28_19835 [Phytomonospora sp. NPDC050363]|uniref:hypothetical protein n=1 Tax=Phytomonospora sp. NPDC050363 TaxID=3155642 RepID=UPI0033F36EEB
MKTVDADDQAAGRSFNFTGSLLLVCLLLSFTMQQFVPAEGGFGAQRLTFRTIWPQGWSYFSSGIAEPVVVAYHLDPRGATTPLSEREASVEALWGLRKSTYAQVDELDSLLGAVPASAWERCDGSVEDCLALVKDLAPYMLRHPPGYQSICGLTALITQVPLPDANVATRGLLTEVQCDLQEP